MFRVQKIATGDCWQPTASLLLPRRRGSLRRRGRLPSPGGRGHLRGLRGAAEERNSGPAALARGGEARRGEDGGRGVVPRETGGLEALVQQGQVPDRDVGVRADVSQPPARG